jgi:hypothetical protein
LGLLINVYTLSSTKLEIRAKLFLLGTLYAHMNKRNKKESTQGLRINDDTLPLSNLMPGVEEACQVFSM